MQKMSVSRGVLGQLSGKEFSEVLADNHWGHVLISNRNDCCWFLFIRHFPISKNPAAMALFGAGKRAKAADGLAGSLRLGRRKGDGARAGSDFCIS